MIVLFYLRSLIVLPRASCNLKLNVCFSQSTNENFIRSETFENIDQPYIRTLRLMSGTTSHSGTEVKNVLFHPSIESGHVYTEYCKYF